MQTKHGLGFGNGRLVEYEDGTVAYYRGGEFTQAFRVSIAEVQSFSVVRGGKMLERTLNLMGSGTLLASVSIPHGTAEKIEEWFRRHPLFRDNAPATVKQLSEPRAAHPACPVAGNSSSPTSFASSPRFATTASSPRTNSMSVRTCCLRAVVERGTAMTVVYESEPLTSPRGGTVKLRLLLLNCDAVTEIRIEREEQLPHKTLESIVIRLREPTQQIDSLARAMTTIVHELERLHRQGYSLRERAGGGWRGAWHSDLLSVGTNPRAVASWEIELRKPGKTLEPLARLLVSLDVPRPVIEAGAVETVSLVAAMREQGRDARREHAIDALIAADPLAPGDEFLDNLESRGLLMPTDEDGDA